MQEEVNTIDAADIVAPMVDTHPEVRPNAVIAHQKREGQALTEFKKETPMSVEKVTDKTGEIFNPEKHYANEFGRPQFTKGGYFKKIPIRKRLKRQAMKALGRPDAPEREPETPKASEPAPEQASDASEHPQPESEQKSFIPDERPQNRGPESAADEYRAAAKALCSTIFTIGVSVGGVQCKPLPQHVESMESAYEQYFRQRGKVDVPPGVAVLLSTGGYALFCYQSSQLVQQQVGGIRGWIVRKVGHWKTNRAARRASKTEGGK